MTGMPGDSLWPVVHSAFTTNPAPSTVTLRCDGSRDCLAKTHVHGCFSDYGDCDQQEQHRG